MAGGNASFNEHTSPPIARGLGRPRAWVMAGGNASFNEHTSPPTARGLGRPRA